MLLEAELVIHLETPQGTRTGHGTFTYAEQGDRFHIPDRDFGDQVWSISEMVIEPRHNILGERELAFNGTVEWALDSIVKRDVVWVPTEGQLREPLGDDFIALYRDDDGSHACVIRLDETPTTFRGDTAPNAYGKALLATLVD